ncbi:MAG: proline iminopeptidase [Spirochaetes bacterium]|nr:MAG: proline iminopeptidase [Spirochaetota bacterium]
MRESYLHVKDKKIWYSVYGEAMPGIPLLVIHGGPGFLSMPEVVSDLSEDRPVYFYDQYGCGNSERAENPLEYSAAYYVEELAEVRAALGLDTVILMGFSWGTALACLYAIKHGCGGIRGLVLCGPFLSTALWDTDQRANIALMPLVVKEAIVEGESKGDYGDSYQAAMMEYYRRHVCRLEPWPDSLQKAFSQLNPEVYTSLWGPSEFTITGALRSLDLVPRLGEIPAPVLLVCGDQDEADPRTVKKYQLAFPDAKMAVIPGASHLHHMERPDLYKLIVQDFLKELP